MEPDSDRIAVSLFPKVKWFGKKTFAFRGCKLWNDLPTNIKRIACNQNLKVVVKAHFVNLL